MNVSWGCNITYTCKEHGTAQRTIATLRQRENHHLVVGTMSQGTGGGVVQARERGAPAGDVDR